MGSFKKVSQIMSVHPNQGYPPQGQAQPGIPPPPPMMNNSTIINNTPAPAPGAPVVINVNQKKKDDPAPAPNQSENNSDNLFYNSFRCIILVLVVLAIGLVWFLVKDGDGQECTSSSSCSSGICDHNECTACKDIGTTSLDCLLHSFSDTSGQARMDCYDICATGCGGEFEGAAGELQSPNYPFAYNNNTDCLYILRTSIGSTLDINFIDFNLEGSYDWSCSYDWLQIFDGPGTQYNSLTPRLCGTSLPDPVSTSSHEAALRFRTDDGVSGTGWKIQYETNQ